MENDECGERETITPLLRIRTEAVCVAHKFTHSCFIHISYLKMFKTTDLSTHSVRSKGSRGYGEIEQKKASDRNLDIRWHKSFLFYKFHYIANYIIKP